VARVAVLAPSELPADLRERAGVTDETQPGQLGSLQVWARVPVLAAALLEVQAAIARSSLPPRLLELVRLRIAFHNQCRSCMALRSQDAVDDGLTEALVCELQTPEAEGLTDAERAALIYADHLSIAHNEVDDDLFVLLREHFSEIQILELGAQVAFCLGFGRVAMSWNLIDDLPAGLRAPGPVGPWDSEGLSRPA
jgi:AhpD family alkylhydroperoxidase